MYSLFLSIIVFMNVALLTILVPGGPVENRDFSNLHGAIFWGFNAFLISLGIASYYTCYAILANTEQATALIQVIAVGYFIVYALDLANIFPKSPTKMSKVLMAFELVNISLSIYLFILAQVL